MSSSYVHSVVLQTIHDRSAGQIYRECTDLASYNNGGYVYVYTQVWGINSPQLPQVLAGVGMPTMAASAHKSGECTSYQQTLGRNGMKKNVNIGRVHRGIYGSESGGGGGGGWLK